MDAVVREGGVTPVATVDFAEWVAARGSSLLRLAYVLTGSASEAEEIVQEALSRALPLWGRISGLEDPDAYVRRMVVNAHTSAWRRFRRREVPVAQVASGRLRPRYNRTRQAFSQAAEPEYSLPSDRAVWPTRMGANGRSLTMPMMLFTNSVVWWRSDSLPPKKCAIAWSIVAVVSTPLPTGASPSSTP